MKYTLKKATNDHIDLLINYKLNNILEYAKSLDKEEIDRINNYVKMNIPKQINNYKIITNTEKIIGCLLVEKYLDGVLLDEIYIEEKYRNQGIGTELIKEVLSQNKITYLWVYKENIKAYNLYKRLGFKISEETETRYFMKYCYL